MSQVIDIDIFGAQNESGGAVEYTDSKAVGNALYLFLTSHQGEFLYQPGVGGVLDKSLFKTMTQESMEQLAFMIRNAISNAFTPYVTLQKLNIKPDYDNRILEIIIIYSTQNGSVDSTTLYVNSDFNTKHFEYTNVLETGENLLQFCMIKKSDMTSQLLILDTVDNLWKWGSYIFINFDFSSDPYAEQILLWCNS
jgi:hypothetical protein